MLLALLAVSTIPPRSGEQASTAVAPGSPMDAVEPLTQKATYIPTAKMLFCICPKCACAWLSG